MGTESLATVGNPGGGLAVQSGEVDLQISTAKRYPRSISTFMERAGKLATRNVEIAARCRYVLTRKKKGGGTTEIVGPSIRLAEIVEQTWGNIRLQARIDDETETYVLVSCLAWDLESNVANVVQVRRSIVGSNGHRYSDDMVNTATMAALAICRRNAILSIVPGAYTAELLDTCMKLITSGGSGSAAGRAESVKTRAKRVLEWMAERGVTEQQVLTLLDLRTLTRIKGDHVATLEGIRTAVEDGQTTLETTFGNPAEEPAPPEEVDPKGSERASTGHERTAGSRARGRVQPPTYGGVPEAGGGPPAHAGRTR